MPDPTTPAPQAGAPQSQPSAVDVRPLTVKDMYNGLPEQMFRMMAARGLAPTLGLRFMALDLANLALTGEVRFPEDAQPVEMTR